MPPRWFRRSTKRPPQEPVADEPNRSTDVPVVASTDGVQVVTTREPIVGTASGTREDSKDELKDGYPAAVAGLNGNLCEDSKDEWKEAGSPVAARRRLLPEEGDIGFPTDPQRPRPLVQSVPVSSALHARASAKAAAYQNEAGSSSAHTMVPIAPGVNARLRGANETYHCIEQDFFVPVVCFACNLDICCIQDADYVICPACKVVSPLEPDAKMSAASKELTVGLGFTFEDLVKWQDEMRSRGSGTSS